MQLGALQARYFGRAKTELQWLIAATVANLTLAQSDTSPEKALKSTSERPTSLLEPITAMIRRITAAQAIRSPQFA